MERRPSAACSCPRRINPLSSPLIGPGYVLGLFFCKLKVQMSLGAIVRFYKVFSRLSVDDGVRAGLGVALHISCRELNRDTERILIRIGDKCEH
jgi:hypothetical protein